MVASKNQVPAIYKWTIKKYKEITNRMLDVEFLTKLQNVQDLTKEIAVWQSCSRSLDGLSAQYYKINKLCVPSTGNWVQSEAIFQDWLNKQGLIIFLCGNPGTGKLYLSTNIVSFVCEQYPQHVQSMILISVGYFFFKDDNPNTRLIHQHLLFVEYFLKQLNIDSMVYILLDTVDEAWDEEQRTLFSLLKELYNHPENAHLQLTVIGHPHISNQLLEGLETEVPTIHVTIQKNSSNINQYIHASINKSVLLQQVLLKLCQEIIKKLSTGTEGDYLSYTVSFSASGNEEELEYLNKVLLWITCSNQSLALAKIESILRLKSPEGDSMIYLEDHKDSLTTVELQNISIMLDLFNKSSDKRDKDEDKKAFTDIKNFIDFNLDRQTTLATFCHAYIGNFLCNKTQGKVSAGPCFEDLLEAKALKTVVAARLELGLARIYSDFLHDQAKATKLWERIMSTYALSKEGTKIGFTKLKVSLNLAQRYLCDTIDAGVGTPEAEEAVAKLERLQKQNKAEENYSMGWAWAFVRVRALSLGIYYHLNRQEEEARALF
ncbi:hypothetical protein AJ80_01416 [Polytolypa hystricis UAMH7299]|uniref:Nephrocystin 3-like N-terminal domain-containing protein n=1 Tax=Polytolypa hystricis (strain UAMH7299) TaxID=1447883 RepID=A0A2B7YYT4_POLH7|nr:hypothetical protein AJ80_01416 [Polytolypa hystricis UAMH7299]